MASVIKHKRNHTAGAIPAPAVLADGEIALNPTDAKIFTKNDQGAVISIGGEEYTLGTRMNGAQVQLTLSDGANTQAITVLGTPHEVSIEHGSNAIRVGLPDDISIVRDVVAGRNLVSAANTVVYGILDVEGESDLHGVSTTTISANGAVSILDTTAATSPTTGSLKVGGGAGIAADLYVGDDLTVGGDTHIDGNLTVEGGTTHIATSTVDTDDGMVKLSSNNVADTVDSGIYAKYVESTTSKYAGYFRDATDGHFKFYKGATVEPGATVNPSGAGYELAQVDAIIDGGTY